MRIAFLSYEFPPDTGGGGIGTYLAQVSHYLATQGHDVQIFAGSKSTPSRSILSGRATLHRISTQGSQEFQRDVLTPFLAEHHRQAFDVIEGTDFDASALAVKQALPALPYVVKLHTPRFVIDELHHRPPTPWQKLRMNLGALRRGRRLQIVPIREQPPALAEIAALRLADAIASPSAAIAEMARDWTGLPSGRFSVFPYPYEPGPDFLKIPAGGATNRITFLGRLEERKGIVDLADAVPLVLARNPGARFRFIGRSMPHGRNAVPMDQFLRHRLGRHAAAVEFTGPRPPEEIAGLLAETDILAAPSHWESFGLICCEGMAAARAVIGSDLGGMAEILDHGSCGSLVPPRCPQKLADGILHLLAHPMERRRLGEAARQRVIHEYSFAKVIPVQIANYEAAIAACRQR